ncbi:MAG: glycosyltransferase [Ignavibacteriae bacterium]|nr:glycosyltransferase [Ignavibacteriota bacterium]
MILLFTIFAFLLLNYLLFLSSILKGLKIVSKNKNISNDKYFVSVIIPFRNEENNLIKSLESLTSQDYADDNFEVIYVDDNSDDNSVKILEEKNNLSNIRIIKSPVSLDERGHKKKALKYAIESCKGEIIITTDADCVHNKTWLSTMVNMFDKETGFVSGPVEFISNKTLFSELQKIEFSSLILVGAGLIGVKQPIICNAANLGFRKAVFDEVGGYDDNLNISSGDDEFLMQKISHQTNYKVKFCSDKNAISFTYPNKSIDEFYQQRKRWASKGLYYVQRTTVAKLVLIFFFYIGLITQLFLGVFSDIIFLYSLKICFILKIIFEYLIVVREGKKLFGKHKIFHFIIAEFIHIPYILVAGISGIFGNYKWKGREIER